MSSMSVHDAPAPRPLERPLSRLVAELPVTGHRLELEGVSTAVLQGGQGPPVVLLHGPGEFAARWLGVIPGLVAHHRVIAPDLPGHGRSRILGGELTPKRVLAWVDALIEAACDEPPALVGHVVGGAIAARYAIDRGDRLDRLVLVDSMGLAPFRPAPRFALTLLGFLARPTPASYRRFMGQCEYDRDRLAQTLGERWDAVTEVAIESARDPEAKAALQVLMRGFGLRPIPAERLAGITVPTTLIWGRHDRALRLSIAEAASARYGWPLRVIEGTADDAPFEQPERFLATLLEVLAPSTRGAF